MDAIGIDGEGRGNRSTSGCGVAIARKLLIILRLLGVWWLLRVVAIAVVVGLHGFEGRDECFGRQK